MKKLSLITFVLFFISVFALNSIDLVKIQKKEKERRKTVKKSKYKVTNDNIVKYTFKKSKSFVKTDREETEEEKKEENKNKVKKEEEKGEEYWRGRLNRLNEQIESLRKRIQQTQSQLNRESSNFLIASIPSMQQQIRENIDKLTKQLTEMKKNLKQREGDRDAFYTEARRAGVPPGWLR